MNISIRNAFGLASLAIAACVLTGAGWAGQEADEPATEQASTQPLWPSRFYVGEDAFTVYPPQLDGWQGERLQARAAVAVQPAGAQRPVFGMVWLSARTVVESASGTLTVRDILRRAVPAFRPRPRTQRLISM